MNSFDPQRVNKKLVLAILLIIIIVVVVLVLLWQKTKQAKEEVPAAKPAPQVVIEPIKISPPAPETLPGNVFSFVTDKEGLTNEIIWGKNSKADISPFNTWFIKKIFIAPDSQKAILVYDKPQNNQPYFYLLEAGQNQPIKLSENILEVGSFIDNDDIFVHYYGIDQDVLAVYNLDTNSIQSLGQAIEYENVFGKSEDGKRFYIFPEPSEPHGNDIWVYEANQTELKKLTTDTKIVNATFADLGDIGLIDVRSNPQEDAAGEIYAINLKTGQKEKWPQNLSSLMIFWHPRGKYFVYYDFETRKLQLWDIINKKMLKEKETSIDPAQILRVDWPEDQKPKIITSDEEIEL